MFVTKCPSYKMLGYEMIRLRDRCYELWLRNVRYEMSKLRHVWQPLYGKIFWMFLKICVEGNSLV